MRKLRQARPLSWPLLPTLRWALPYPGRERSLCEEGGVERTSMLETGKLRQPLICPEWRVNQEECLALPQEHRLSTSTRGIKLPRRPGGCRASTAAFPHRTHTRSKSPASWLKPLPGCPVRASSRKTSGLCLFFPEVQREALIFPDAPAFIKNFS